MHHNAHLLLLQFSWFFPHLLTFSMKVAIKGIFFKVTLNNNFNYATAL